MVPNAVPFPFWAIAQKKYVVPALKPVIGRLYGTWELPPPSDVPPLLGALVPNESLQLPGWLVLYRNQPVAEVPFGSAEPLRVAALLVTEVAAPVETVGGENCPNVSLTNANRKADVIKANAKYLAISLLPICDHECACTLH